MSSPIGHCKNWPKGVWPASVCQGNRDKSLKVQFQDTSTQKSASQQLLLEVCAYRVCNLQPINVEGAHRKDSNVAKLGSMTPSCTAEPLRHLITLGHRGTSWPTRQPPLHTCLIVPPYFGSCLLLRVLFLHPTRQLLLKPTGLASSAYRSVS